MKIKSLTLLVLFLLPISIGFSNVKFNNDSLIGLIKKSEESEKMRLINVLLKNQSSELDLDSTYTQLKGLVEEFSPKLKTELEHFTGVSYFSNFQSEEKAVNHYLKGIKIAKENNDSLNISNLNYSLSALYFWRKDYKKSSSYAQKCFNYFPSDAELKRKSKIYVLLGSLQLSLDKNYDEALRYYKLAYETQLKSGNHADTPITLNNIGEIYFLQKNYKKAKEYLNQAIEISDSLSIMDAKAYGFYVLGQVEIKQGNYDEGVKKIEGAIDWWKNNNYKKDLIFGYEVLYKAYQDNNQYKKASEIQDSLILLNEKLYEERKIASLEEMRTKYESDQKELELEKKQKEAELANQRTEMVSREKQIQIIVFLVIGFLLIVNAIYFFLRYKQQKKDKEIISTQKEVLTERNKEILDSINYAKRLQDAILPSEKIVKSFLVDSFILYKPKDIVAGDFYYMDVIEEDRKKLIYYVAADCTGHGVPGAMVSIVGANGLKRCIQEFNLRKTGDILDKLAELVATNFSQSEERIRDGMDLAICCLELENDNIQRVHYSGANNPLWVINPNRKTIPNAGHPFAEGGGFEIKADKQAIGYTENVKPFTTHSFDVQKGDSLYTFSDGYPDQFGGENGKKLKSKNFRKILFEIQNKPMRQQHLILNERFEEWKGNLEQVDDVCVIGVRL